MKNLIVLLISEQTIPNIEFIRALDKKLEFDFLFITTERSENDGVSDVIERLAIMDYEGRIHKLKTSHENYETIVEDINEFIEDNIIGKYADILINITGGTKMMAIGTYSAFNDILQNTSKFYYTSTDDRNKFTNIKKTGKEINKNDYLSVEDYFRAYHQNNIKSDLIGISNLELCKNLFLFHTQKIENEPLRVINEFMVYLQQNKIITKINENIFIFSGDESKLVHPILKLHPATFFAYLDEIGFKLKEQSKISNDDRVFFNGGWFEDYTYNLLFDYITEIGGDIKKNVFINKDNKEKPENQLDVVITYKNRLFVIENKFSVLYGNELNDYLYKIEAIKNKFGLTPISILATLDPKEDMKEKQARLDDFRIKLLTGKDFYDKSTLIAKVKTLGIKN